MDICNNLNESLNTHALDDKYHEIVCMIYKCPFKLAFKPGQQNKSVLTPVYENIKSTTHCQLQHDKMADDASDNEM